MRLRTIESPAAALLVLAAFALTAAPGSAASRFYDLVAYDPPGPNSIVSGTITTDGTLGSDLDPTAIITNFSATLTDGSTTQVIDFATDGVFSAGATVTATATELTLDAGTPVEWSLGRVFDLNHVLYEDVPSAPTEMRVDVHVFGSDSGLVGSRVIATVAPPIVYNLVAYDPPGPNSIVSGTITTNGILGSGLDPAAIITNYSATLTDGSTTTVIDFATNGLAHFVGAITASATELTLDHGAGGILCLSSTCGTPNGIVYEDRLSAPTEMNVLLYVDGSNDDQGLVGSRIIATNSAPVPVPSSGVPGRAILGILLLFGAMRVMPRRS